MNGQLYLKELKREFKNFFIGTAIVVIYIALTMVIFSSMETNIESVTEIWATLPESFQTALNFGDDSWNTITGFYTTYFVFYIPLIAGGFAVVWGLKMLAKEEQHKTAEFLLTKPISRNRILTSKLGVILTYVLAMNLLGYASGIISCLVVDPDTADISVISILHLYGLFTCLFFVALGLFISTLMKRSRTLVGMGIGIVLGMYLFDMILKISNKAEFLLYLTPFKYLDLNVNAPGYHLEGWRILIPLSVSILLVMVSYLSYRKRDILI